MLDSLFESGEATSLGLEGGRGISLGPVLLDKENPGATHNPSIRSCFDFRLIRESRDDLNSIRVACLRRSCCG